MCLCKIERSPREGEDVIVVPNRPIPRAATSYASSGNPAHSRPSLSVPSPRRSKPLTYEGLQSQPRSLEARTLRSQGRVVLVETITPRTSDPTVTTITTAAAPLGPTLLRRESLRSGSTHGRSPRDSGNVIELVTCRQPGDVVLHPRHSGNAVVLRPPTRSPRHSAASFRGPRQSNASVRSASYRSTREKMVEVDEEDGRVMRRVYDRRDDPRR